MAKGKKYTDAAKRYDREQLFSPAEAVELVKGLGTAGFDESIELAMRLGVDPRKADQIVRGTVALPSGAPSAIVARHVFHHRMPTSEVRKQQPTLNQLRELGRVRLLLKRFDDPVANVLVRVGAVDGCEQLVDERTEVVGRELCHAVGKCVGVNLTANEASGLCWVVTARE